MKQFLEKFVCLSIITHTRETWLKNFCLLAVMFACSVQIAFSQGINVDAPSVVEVNTTRVSLSIGSENTTSYVTWNVPNAQIVYQSPNKSTIEVIFNTTGVKYIQAWHTSIFGNQQYGTASIEVFGVAPVFITGQVRQWGGGVLSGVWVDAYQIGGSDSRSGQTTYDGTYNFYVPKGTSWKVVPRGNNPCASFIYYPQKIYNVQQTPTLDFYKYNAVFVSTVTSSGYSIRVMDGGGQAYYAYTVYYEDGTQDVQPLAWRGTVDVFPSPKRISSLGWYDPNLDCSIWQLAN